MQSVEYGSPQSDRAFLQQVRLKMPVYDKTNTRLGTVVRAYDHSCADQPLVGNLPYYRCLDHMPPNLADRLRRESYIEVDSGLLAGDYFVLTRQIADVTDKGILLLFHRNELIQL